MSTSCGIPDFRGPQGIWTKQRRGEAMPTCDVGFGFATPSLTHRAIAQLVRMKRVDYVASQNVDGERAGAKAKAMAWTQTLTREWNVHVQAYTPGRAWTGRSWPNCTATASPSDAKNAKKCT